MKQSASGDTDTTLEVLMTSWQDLCDVAVRNTERRNTAPYAPNITGEDIVTDLQWHGTYSIRPTYGLQRLLIFKINVDKC